MAVLQIFGIIAAASNSFGLASVFPILSGIVSKPSIVIHKTLGEWFPDFEPPQFLLENFLGVAGGLLILFFAAKFTSTVFFNAYGGRLLEKLAVALRSRILERYENSLYVKFNPEPRSGLLFFNSQLPTLVTYNWAIIESLLKLYNVIFILILLVILSPRISLVLGAIFPVVVLALYPFLVKARNAASLYYYTQKEVWTKFLNYIEGVDVIRTLSLKQKELRELQSSSRKLITQHTWLSAVRSAVNVAPEILLVAIGVTLLITLKADAIDLAFFATYGYGILKFTAALNEFTVRFSSLLEGKRAADQLYEFLKKDVEVQIDEYDTPTKVSTLETEKPANFPGDKTIRFENVSVCLRDKPILRDINLTIHANGITQIIGRNGSGKSTLIRSLARLVPFEGRIFIGSIDIRNIPLAEYYQHLGYHGQDIHVVAGSLKDNLLLGNPTGAETLQPLLNQLKIRLKDFFPKGLDHTIEESGKNLSGGERQLICLIRVLLRKPPILILDEYSNHLSSDATQQILNYLKELKETTVILISHQILVETPYTVFIEDGRLVEAHKPVKGNGNTIST